MQAENLTSTCESRNKLNLGRCTFKMSGLLKALPVAVKQTTLASAFKLGKYHYRKIYVFIYYFNDLI